MDAEQIAALVAEKVAEAVTAEREASSSALAAQGEAFEAALAARSEVFAQALDRQREAFEANLDAARKASEAAMAAQAKDVAGVLARQRDSLFQAMHLEREGLSGALVDQEERLVNALALERGRFNDIAFDVQTSLTQHVEAQKPDALADGFEGLAKAVAVAARLEVENHAARTVKVALFKPNGDYVGFAENTAELIDRQMGDSLFRLAWRPEWDALRVETSAFDFFKHHLFMQPAPTLPNLFDIPGHKSEIAAQVVGFLAAQIVRA